MLEDWSTPANAAPTIYAEVLGFGSSFDAYAVTKPDPEGRGGAAAIRNALQEARIDRERRRLHQRPRHQHPAQRHHGDGGRQACHGRKARDACRCRRSSRWSATLIGAAGAVEAVALAMTLSDHVLPPTINLTNPDPACDLDYVPNTARDYKPKIALSTSFGFGGQNRALVMKAI